jgi:Protein of unknown function (DUF3726)
MTDAPITDFSFNEIITLAAKAARGAGLGWGQAEDIGRAARWLAERGLPWDAALCRLLEAKDAVARTSRMVEVGDWAADAAQGEVRIIEDMRDAIWIIPLVSAAIFGRPRSISVRCSGTDIYLSPDGAMASDGENPLLSDQSGPGRIEAIATEAPLRDQQRRSRPDPISPEALATLSIFADRTLVPASDVSRAKGAGAAQSDND